MDENQQHVEEAREYLQIFNNNFQEGIISLSDTYFETVANYFGCIIGNGDRNESIPYISNSVEELHEELNKAKANLKEVQALLNLLQSALRVSQILIEKNQEKIKEL